MKKMAQTSITWLVALGAMVGLLGGQTPARGGAAPGGVPDSADDIQPLEVGQRIPETLLRTLKDEPFDLNAAAARKPVVLIFYRGGWCPYCNKHLARLRDIEPELLRLGYQILAVSADSPATLREAGAEEKEGYRVLSDSTMAAAKAFGLAFKVDDATLGKYKGYGIDLEAASGESHHLLPVPAALVIGTDGRVKFSYVNPNYKVRVDPEVLLAAAKAAAL